MQTFKHPGMQGEDGAEIIADIGAPATYMGAWTLGFYRKDKNGMPITPTVATFDKSAFKAFLLELVKLL